MVYLFVTVVQILPVQLTLKRLLKLLNPCPVSYTHLNDIMLGVPYTMLETNDLVYKCNCSHEKISAAIMSLGYKEVKAMLEEQGEAEVVCRFCGKKHYFDSAELKKIVDELDKQRFKDFVANLNNQIDLQQMAVEQQKNSEQNSDKKLN